MKRKHIIISEIAFLFLLLGFTMVLGGMFMNTLVTETNNGMPVWTTNFIPKQGYFQIVDASEIEYLFLADIYPVFKTVYSLGDLLMFFGFGFLCASLALIYYKSMKNWLGEKK